MRWKKPRAALLTAALLSLLLPFAADAQPKLSGQGIGDVHVHLSAQEEIIHPAGVDLALFEIAEGSYFDGEAHLLEDFPEEELHHDLQDMVEHSAEVSKELEEWVEVEHPMEPVEERISDQNGDLEFDHLDDGVYLVCQENVDEETVDGEYIVEVEPFLIEVPMPQEDGSLAEEFTCRPKLSLRRVQRSFESIEVEKHWDDDNDRQGLRPVSIQVTLYSDGLEWDTETLDAGNNWRYSWSGLMTGPEWTVKETAVPKGYFSETSREGNTVIITNRLTPGETETETETETQTETVTETQTETQTETGTETETIHTTESESGPGGSPPGKTPGKRASVKTGDTARPVLYLLTLIGAGLVLILTICARKKHKET